MDGEIRNVEYDFTSVDFTTKRLLPLYERLIGEYHPEYGICLKLNFSGEVQPDVVREIDVAVTVG